MAAVTSDNAAAIRAIVESVHGEDQTAGYWASVVNIVTPVILEQAAQAIELEANRGPNSWREKVAWPSFLESRNWLRQAAVIVRRLK